MPSADYPRMLFHRSREPVTVQSRDEEDALGPEWSRTIWTGAAPAPAARAAAAAPVRVPEPALEPEPERDTPELEPEPEEEVPAADPHRPPRPPIKRPIAAKTTKKRRSSGR